MFPRAKFRTGNAIGTDEAFAGGVKNVDPCRLEFVVPYGTLRKSKVPPESAVFSLQDICGNVWAEICRQTKEASPRIAPPIDLFRKVGGKKQAHSQGTLPPSRHAESGRFKVFVPCAGNGGNLLHGHGKPPHRRNRAYD